MKVLALAKAQKPADQTGMLYKDCVGKGNYTTNSTYHANLNKLLTSIYTNNEINNGFYNFSYGQDADTVYSIALCRPDIRPDDCRSCIRNASDSLVRNCPNFVEAIGGLDNCMVRYANRSIFDRMEQGPYFWMYDDRFNVSDVVGFNQSRMTLLGRLSDQAAAGDSRYKDCLYNASGLIPQCCNARPGGRVIYPSCNFRYEKDRFYDPSTNSIPPPPDSTLTNSIPSPPASTSQGNSDEWTRYSCKEIAGFLLRERRKDSCLRVSPQLKPQQLDICGYMAPEYIARGHFSVKSDVYSFGVLVLEIVSGRKIGGSGIGDEGEDLLTYVSINTA
ncbi:hypothetical protein DKX38_016971 [Salix brachista]|uniref:Gnk2-homologous domain-containing protein n=1 Tax=Salix brachista TaxID=2182728 RepID=A0A5N5KTX8_9ROSI|nr:hypothetical protein DKX38_016971 [Salix brachista]